MITTSQKDGMYAPPAALGPNRQQICGTLPDSATWLRKIRPAPRRPGNRSTWSVIRAPGRVDEPEDRQLVTQRDLGHPDDLLHRPGTPGARLHARVVGHHKRCSPLHQPAACDNAVGGQIVRHRIGQLAILDEGRIVEQQGDPIAYEELVRAAELGRRSFRRRKGPVPRRTDAGP